MNEHRRKLARWVPAVGAATVAVTATAGLAPARAHAATAAPLEHQVAPSRQAANDSGTYQSCAAYFGFGKNQGDALDLVEFDVTDVNGHDGIHHMVGTDTQVVLVLTNAQGQTLECLPQELTQALWDDGVQSFQVPQGAQIPAYPGAGHYIYPSVAYQPYINNFGTVVAVGFEVTGIPAGHTLVSPTAVKALVQHYSVGFEDTSFDPDPRVTSFITSGSGSGDANAYAAALAACNNNGTPNLTPGTITALNQLQDLIGAGHTTAADTGCYDLGFAQSRASFLLGLQATLTYTEPIDLRLPEPPTTTTVAPTTTTTVAGTSAPTAPSPGSPAPPAIPILAEPTYTG